MKKSMRKFLSMILASAMSFSLGTLVYASPTDGESPPAAQSYAPTASVRDGPISVQYIYTDAVTYSFLINPGGLARIDATMYLESNATSCKIEAVLQRRKSGGSWGNVKTVTATGSSFVVMSESLYVSSGYEYRVMFHFYAYVNGRLAEQIDKTSPIRTY